MPSKPLHATDTLVDHPRVCLAAQAPPAAVGPSGNDGSSSSSSNTSRVLVDSSLTGRGGSNGSSSSSAGLGTLFKGGLFKGAATVSMSSTDDDRVAADEAAGQVLMPKHWEEQIRTAPLGRRRVMRRCVAGERESAKSQRAGSSRVQGGQRTPQERVRGCTPLPLDRLCDRQQQLLAGSRHCPPQSFRRRQTRLSGVALTAHATDHAAAPLTCSSCTPPCCRAVASAAAAPAPACAFLILPARLPACLPVLHTQVCSSGGSDQCTGAVPACPD